jgi:uncharacterized protein (TIGR02145 family)
MIKITRLSVLGFLIISAILYSCRKEEIPAVTTADITSITTTSAKSGGNITSDGGAKITSRGVCWNSTGNPTVANKTTSDGTGTGSFSSSLTLLKPGTYYYLRAYATNNAGTGYGNEQSFATLDIITGSLDDIEGNTYKTVTIGTQVWMAENLKTTRYNDNTLIPLVTDNVAWSHLITPGYCWYNNDASAFKSDYGALYNWYTVATGKLCPSGWHVPTDLQWSELAEYLGGETLAGDKLKEEGEAHWTILNSGATNESGFTALPGGGRIDGSFVYIGTAGAWWTATAYDAENALCRELDNNIVELLKGYLGKNQGFSVRCIQD